MLVLWGDAQQAGFAHGWLLADRIAALIDDFVLDPRILPSTYVYETLVLPAARGRFEWREPCERELAAMLAGARERLGPGGFRSKRLERELTLEDLLVANTLADWMGLFCSSFSAWGELTRDGQTLTGRNLDYPSTTAMEEAQLIVVRRAHGGERGWVGVGWPGAIGVFTAMNADGVTIMMHDAPGLPASETEGFAPRSLALREALEAAAGETFQRDVERVLEKRRTLVGNLVHASAPRAADRDRSAAVVFEYDGNRKDSGVTARTPADNAPPAELDALWCTNHMCRRDAPSSRTSRSTTQRFDALRDELGRRADERTPLDAAAALELIRRVRQRITLHTVVFEPARRRMHVLIPRLSAEPVAIDLAGWLRD